MIGSRRWMRRALLSALAGGGMTAASLGGTLNALAAETTTNTTTETTSTSETETSTQASPPTSTTTTETLTATTPLSTSTTATSTTAESPPTATTETTTTSSSPTSTTATPPAVEHQSDQKATTGTQSTTTQTQTTAQSTTAAQTAAEGAGNVALPPEVLATQPGSLGALLENAPASTQALQFFRVPLFLLPIYQAAAVQYGVPWEILAAINEVETNYGTDLAVSSAGAVGWMQFMPQTWLQYGVDALNAGYADPNNPVDAVFAAARYLRAAGASKDIRQAIFAYNHSQAYVETVILRARLLASYPESVLATLTGLTDGSPPFADAKLLAQPPASAQASSSSSATAGATALASGSSLAPTPQASGKGKGKVSYPTQFVRLIGPGRTPVVAVEDGRVVALGDSRKLGKYLILRDVYGDVFTYAGLGSIAPSFRLPKDDSSSVPQSASTGAETANDPAPKLPASAGHQPTSAQEAASTASTYTASSAPAGKVRLFAHPDNPEAIAATNRLNSDISHNGWLALKRGSVVAQGTVIGHLGSTGPSELRFAIRPAGDQSTIEPGPILENWKQLNAALHPRGAKGNSGLIGATADDVFLLTKGELERAVLSDPGVTLNACDRQEIASGATQNGVLAALLFLSRSGLKPTVSTLRCGQAKFTAAGLTSPYYAGDAVSISAINGVKLAGHQGPGTITDLTIRTLLTLQGQFAPYRIISTMRYPGAASTIARSSHRDYLELEFLPAKSTLVPAPKRQATKNAHTATVKTAPTPLSASQQLGVSQWNQLVARISALQMPNVSNKPSKFAIRDHQASQANKDLGTHNLP